ncbi:MAG: sirohydrochlorin chelatase [gamma proteobacterium symbiont of Bathyaustriella thionipta]|nr:sirohydrochlorin chelatase [gamma proteobacterium symbiont of Bathyaustriella thionipta]MCU7949641.1 sirohydrochlorin chelatase [gamma proteobacterium symbiont of Bathyaustriella thionipta]MCU7954832.1 sirohydrochlorin chelatase [gamma proteobacterium symbiont of Bathyaustriella thionipta]MCU7956220.1 sirohydrochlorin chelatase [gamma proteobacterium symbiont of Bathyaustriella thionipta]MCU7966066.1 sirohydrochlorin chelatase [gamma proteobacterium symbiont of Bathyaustriella thionipta]
MKEMILIIGHGSRNKTGNGQILEFTKQLCQRQPQWEIEVCYIELADYLIDEGLRDAAKKADRVVVIPLILNAAGHVKEEIPEYIETAQKESPETEFIYAQHLGTSELVLNVLNRYLKETMQSLAMPDPKTTGVIVLGRGSSDHLANGEMAKMTRWIYEANEHDLVDLAFTGVAYPRLETAVQRQVKLGMKQVIILPYYLFDGILIERIDLQVERLSKQYPDISFAKSSYFGFEQEIYELFEQRVNEAL